MEDLLDKLRAVHEEDVQWTKMLQGELEQTKSTLHECEARETRVERERAPVDASTQCTVSVHEECTQTGASEASEGENEAVRDVDTAHTPDAHRNNPDAPPLQAHMQDVEHVQDVRDVGEECTARAERMRVADGTDGLRELSNGRVSSDGECAVPVQSVRESFEM